MTLPYNNDKQRAIEQILGFHKLPRYVGLNHMIAWNKKQYIHLLNALYHTNIPFFVSTFYYKSFIPIVPKPYDKTNIIPYKVVIDKLPFDFDINIMDDDNETTSNISNPYNSTFYSANSPQYDYTNHAQYIDYLKKLKKKIEPYVDKIINEFNLPLYIVYSGFKGFHFYIKLKPTIYEVHTDKTYQRATDRLFSAQVFFDKKRYADPSIFGMINGMIRLPNMPYISKNSIRTEYYTIPLTIDEFLTLSVEEILDLAKKPRHNLKLPAPSHKRLFSLMQLIKEFDIEIKNSRVRVSIHHAGQFFHPLVENSLPTHDLIDLFLRHYPCVANAIKLPNPSHKARVNATMHLAELFSLSINNNEQEEIQEISAIIETLYAGLNWIDYNPKITHQQVISIVSKRGRYKPPKCRKLQLEGFCIGEKCPFYSQ